MRDPADLFPDSVHVRTIGLKSARDRDLGDHARDKGFVIVSRDNDFQQMSFVWGHPPKVIWIRRGNCSVRESESIPRTNSVRIHDFEADSQAAFLVLS